MEALRDAASRTPALDAVDVGPAVPRHLRRHADAVRRVSEEDPARRGLGVLPGTVRLAPAGREAAADAVEPCSTLDDARRPDVRRSRRAEPWVYFVHSLHGVPDDADGRRRHVRLRRPVNAAFRSRQRVRHAVPPREVGRQPGCGCSRNFVGVAAPPSRRDGAATRRSTCAAASVVRLRQGDYAQRPSTATTRSRSPVVRRRRGATWIHVVDLDAAALR